MKLELFNYPYRQIKCDCQNNPHHRAADGFVRLVTQMFFQAGIGPRTIRRRRHLIHHRIEHSRVLAQKHAHAECVTHGDGKNHQSDCKCERIGAIHQEGERDERNRKRGVRAGKSTVVIDIAPGEAAVMSRRAQAEFDQLCDRADRHRNERKPRKLHKGR